MSAVGRMKKGCGYIEVDNIFDALGFPDAKELRAQTLLGIEVCKRIRAMKATQKEIAARLDITQPQVSELKRGKFEWKWGQSRIQANEES